MLTMTKRKKPDAAGREPRGMIPFKPAIFQLLKALAKKNKRPLSWEADLMARHYLEANGIECPPDNGEDE